MSSITKTSVCTYQNYVNGQWVSSACGETFPVYDPSTEEVIAQVASSNAADIDKAVKLGLNHPMGPLELADFIGLDTSLSVMQVLYEGLADSKYRPCPVLVKYVEAGWLGRKANRGFYDYHGEKPVPTR